LPKFYLAKLTTYALFFGVILQHTAA